MFTNIWIPYSTRAQPLLKKAIHSNHSFLSKLFPDSSADTEFKTYAREDKNKKNEGQYVT